MRMQRYLFLSLLWSLPVFAAQHSPDVRPAADHAPSVVAAPNGSSSRASEAAGVAITAEQWARPRSGRGIARLPGVAALVEAAGRDAANRLVIRYAAGDEGTLWAEELRSWLVALGLPSARLTLEPGLPQPDRLQLELRPPR